MSPVEPGLLLSINRWGLFNGQVPVVTQGRLQISRPSKMLRAASESAH